MATKQELLNLIQGNLPDNDLGEITEVKLREVFSSMLEYEGFQGDAFEYNDFTALQLEALKGDKGDAFEYSDFTAQQLEDLKGEKGDAFEYSDFTASQLEALKGDAFEYSDLNSTQKNDLRQGMQPITVANTSNVVSFETNAIKGTAAQPITSALTLSLANALMGSVVTVWYSGSVLPSFVDKWLNASDAEFSANTLCLLTFHLHSNNYIVAIHNT